MVRWKFRTGGFMMVLASVLAIITLVSVWESAKVHGQDQPPEGKPQKVDLAKALERSVLDAQSRRRVVEEVAAKSLRQTPYRLRVGDRVIVEARCTPANAPIKGEHVVRFDGTISLGFYGDVVVAGLNRTEVKEKVIEHLRKHLDDKTLGLVGHDQSGNLALVPLAESDQVYVDESPALRAMTEAEFQRAAQDPPTIQIDSFIAIEARRWLDQSVNIDFPEKAPLKDVLAGFDTTFQFVSFNGFQNDIEERKFQFYLDPSGLTLANLTATPRVQLKLESTNEECLKLILRQVGLVCKIERGGVIRINHPQLVQWPD